MNNMDIIISKETPHYNFTQKKALLLLFLMKNEYRKRLLLDGLFWKA